MAAKLTAYEAKRDFQQTTEPKGDDLVRPSAKLRFVVQRHDATRLHYDLRLELDGVFKSWAVTRGPSLNPADKRLAVEVEDHPLAYGDFEGTIPKGQYGGGTVQLFDRGTWEPEGKRPPEKALSAGELKFVLHGRRLKGSFVLVRMRADKFRGKRTNWLLIKHRDAFANDAGGGVVGIDTSVASGRPLDRIAAGKGRAPKPFMLEGARPASDAIWDSSKGLAKNQRVAKGVERPAGSKKGKATGKPATKETMPTFIEPQLCRSVAKPPSGRRWLHEIKFDGYRMQLRVEDGDAALHTRTGLDWTARFTSIAKAAKALPDAILDGEVVALGTDGNPSFAALQAAIAAEKTASLTFFAFDLLFLDGVDQRRKPLTMRKAALDALLAGRKSPLLRYVEHFEADGGAVFESARDLGLEGIVSKQTTAVYRSGRSDSWTKAKSRLGHEVVLGGWTETNGNFRSLLGGVFRAGKLAYVGRIGTGYSAAVVKRLMPQLDANRAAMSPFMAKGAPPRDRAIRWLKPTLVAEVEFAGWSTDGLVRQAAFKGLREDKTAKSIVAETPKAKRADASLPAIAKIEPPQTTGEEASFQKTKPPPRATSKAKVSVMGVTLSHPDKALWPDAGDDTPVTKKDLADYFAAVGDWMLPHIAGRACSIIRAPDGIDKQTFFQGHAMAGGSELFETIRIAGDREPYLVIDDIAALAAVAQSGGLELHPSNAKPGEPLVPGRLVFDLDPGPDVAFDTVVEAARQLRARLDALGLAAFCKTTGGKGLHVVTPLKPTKAGPDWKAAKAFAQQVCVTMEREAPSDFLTKSSKAARKGRIYLDYLRNDRLSTAVAPLSPRARPHAPVSMPLTWTQVKAGLDPLRFTVRTVPTLLKRSKAWADYDKAAAPLADAIAALNAR